MSEAELETHSTVKVSPALDRILRCSDVILRSIPVVCYICDVDGRILQYNDRAVEQWRRRPQPGEVHSHFTAETQFFSPDGTRWPRSKLEDTLETGRPLRDAEMTVVRPNGDLFVVLLNALPLFDEQGKQLGAVFCIQDISERERAAEAVAHSQRYLREQQQRWTATYEHAAIGIVETDADGRFLRVNEAGCNIVGMSREQIMAGRLFERDFAEDRDRDAAQYRRQVAGEIDFYSTEKRVVRSDGSMVWCSIRSSTVRAADGNFLYAVRVMQDVTERKEAENRQKLLIDELNHRVKNTLATVQSLATQTARGTSTPEEFHQAFDGRLIALAHAHDQLTRRNWASADLRDIVSGVIGPLVTQASDQFAIAGAAVTLGPRTALTLALAIHELTTNAVKYGALSVSSGRVNVDWRVERETAQPPALRLEWRERNGPAVTAPTRRGFGSRFIESAVAAELKGRAALRFDPDGLGCVMEIPLDPKLFTTGAEAA